MLEPSLLSLSVCLHIVKDALPHWLLSSYLIKKSKSVREKERQLKQKERISSTPQISAGWFCVVFFFFFHINWLSPRAATAASNPSSSSPGISLLRFRLGGREPVGETTTTEKMIGKKIWKMSTGILGLLKSIFKMVGKGRCETYQGCRVRQIWSLPAWEAEPADSHRSFHHEAAPLCPLWKSFLQDPVESSSGEPPPLTPDMPASPNTRAQQFRNLGLKILHCTSLKSGIKTLQCILSCWFVLCYYVVCKCSNVCNLCMPRLLMLKYIIY